MSQLTLFSIPNEVRDRVLWCRLASGCLESFVVGVAWPAPPTVVLWFCQSCYVEAVDTLPSGHVALLVRVPGSLSLAFHSLPAPHGGSRHESNSLAV